MSTLQIECPSCAPLWDTDDYEDTADAAIELETAKASAEEEREASEDFRSRLRDAERRWREGKSDQGHIEVRGPVECADELGDEIDEEERLEALR